MSGIGTDTAVLDWTLWMSEDGTETYLCTIGIEPFHPADLEAQVGPLRKVASIRRKTMAQAQIVRDRMLGWHEPV